MHEYIAESFMHAGFRVQIIADQDAQSPEGFGDDGLFIVTTRNRYFQKLHQDMDAAECMADKALCKRYWIFPVYAYVHGGVALSMGTGGQFSDPWDSGQIGFVLAAKDEWRYRTHERKKCVSAATAARGHVETWNQYLSGDVWGYVVSEVEGEEGEVDDTSVIQALENYSEEDLNALDEIRNVDSCWGFYGIDYCRTEAKGAAQSARKVEDREAAKIDAAMHL